MCNGDRNEKDYVSCTAHTMRDQYFDARLTTTIEFDGSLERDAFFWGGSLKILFLSSVEGIHVSLVVLGMVQRHDLLRNVGLEGIVGVGEGRKSVSHGSEWMWMMMERKETGLRGL